MNCTRITPLLPLYASADLAAPQLAQVRAHLAQCESCAASAAEFATAHEWLRREAVPEFDETFFAELRYAVRQELAVQPVRAAWWSLRWQPLVVAAALLLLIIFSLRLFQTKGVPPTDIVNGPASSPTPDAAREPMPPIKRLAQTNNSRVPLRKQTHASPIKQEEHETIAVATAAITTKPVLPVEAENAAEPVMSRIELQTADPNIRIIWLTPKTYDVSVGSLTR